MQLYIPRSFKIRALQALKGNWQTALLVSFFASFFTLALSVATERLFPEVSYLYMGDGQRFIMALGIVPQSSWLILGVLSVFAFVMTPALVVGAIHYYLSRLQGQELGFRGLFSRFSIFLKCLWMYVIMFVKTFLWTCLFIVPGIMAAFRYALAPYYLASDPSLSAMEAIEKSKQTMENRKMSLFMLDLSFIGWSLLNSLLSLLLFDLSAVLSTVVSLMLSTFIAAYSNASIAAFFKTVSNPDTAMKEAFQPDSMTPPDGSDDNLDDHSDDDSKDDSSEDQ